VGGYLQPEAGEIEFRHGKFRDCITVRQQKHAEQINSSKPPVAARLAGNGGARDVRLSGKIREAITYLRERRL
jgi:hypothetical protein